MTAGDRLNGDTAARRGGAAASVSDELAAGVQPAGRALVRPREPDVARVAVGAAAGSSGHLEVEFEQGPPLVVRVFDNGSGPPHGPHSGCERGLRVLRSLAHRLDAAPSLCPGRAAGTVAEVVLDAGAVPASRGPDG